LDEILVVDKEILEYFQSKGEMEIKESQYQGTLHKRTPNLRQLLLYSFKRNARSNMPRLNLGYIILILTPINFQIEPKSGKIKKDALHMRSNSSQDS
jgi:hypothetical protein